METGRIKIKCLGFRGKSLLADASFTENENLVAAFQRLDNGRPFLERRAAVD